jgi:type II secretory pathway pseudopilin PulG
VLLTAQSKTDGAGQRIELRAHLQGRPDQHAAMQTEVVAAVDKARSQMSGMLAELQREQPALAVLAKHYVTAMDKSLTVTPDQTETVIAVGFRMPTLPAFAAAPSVQNRVAAQGEAAVVQFNAGGPLLDALVAATDVFAQPLDRAAVTADLLKLLPAGAPVSTSSVVVSMGGNMPNDLVFSATTANAGQLQSQRFQWGETFAESKIMPWGVALAVGGPASSEPPPTIDPRLDQPSATTILRGAIDVSKLPAQLQAQVGQLVRTAFFDVGMSRAILEIQAAPGQGKALLGFWDLGKKQMLAQVEPMYAQRTSFEDPSQEIGAIFAYHWAKLLIAAVAPNVVGDDLLRIDFEMNKASFAFSGAFVMGTALVGVVAAVAIPAFLDYSKKGKVSEAQLMLNRIMKNQKITFLTNGSYVVGSSALVPAMSCCEVDTDGKKKCFRYSIESTATGYIAKAVGDLDCDGVEVTYVLEGSTQAGNPTAKLTAPDNAD